MPININLLKSKQVNASALPKYIIDSIINDFTNIPDLGMRLFKLPIIPKGKQHNSFPQTNVTQYVAEKALSTGLDAYIGYFVYYHPQRKRWTLHEHAFNVDKAGKVQEHAKGMDWKETCYYVGMRVPKEDYENSMYANHFKDMSYIKKYSARALFDIPKPKE